MTAMDNDALLRADRSIRRFTREAIAHEDLVAMTDAARTASCSMNRQTLSFVVLESAKEVAAMHPLVRWAALLKGAGNPTEDEFPAAYVIITTPLEAKGFTDIDVGIAATTLRLSALSRGIASCIIGSHDPRTVEATFALPQDRSARLVIALGYPAMTSTVETATAGDTAYYLDEKKNCHVPKRPFADVVSFR